MKNLCGSTHNSSIAYVRRATEKYTVSPVLYLTGHFKKFIMKKFSTRDFIILNNLIMILLLGFSLTGLIVTCDIIFIYMFVTCCPVALVTMLTLDKYEKEF